MLNPKDAKDFLKLIFGSPHGRIARVLISGGITIMIGPPVIYLVILTFTEITAEQVSEWTGETPWYAPFVVGLALVLLGVLVFWWGQRNQIIEPPKDQFNFTIPNETWSFEETVQMIAKTEGRAVEFLGFEASALSEKMRGERVRADDYLSAIAALRGFARSQEAIPKYAVTNDETKIVVQVE